MQQRAVAFVLARGRGNRLFPLTQECDNPAVPFGGKYRSVDFALSNRCRLANPRQVHESDVEVDILRT